MSVGLNILIRHSFMESLVWITADIMRQTTCLVVNPIIVDGYASLLKCTTAVRAWRYVFGLARRGSTIGFHLLWHTVELAMSTRLCLF